MALQLSELLTELGIAEQVQTQSVATLNPIPIDTTPPPAPTEQIDGLIYPQVDPLWIMPQWRHADYLFNEIAQRLAIGRASYCLLTGPTGTGKTHAIAQWSALNNRAMLVCPCNRDMTETSLFAGTQEIENGTSKWTDGPFVRAARHNAVLVLEEFNNLNLTAQISLQSRTDRDTIVMTLPQTGETIVWKQPIVFAACNEGYAGTSDISTAIRNRFQTVETKYLNEQSEVDLLNSRTGIDRKLALKAVRTANAIRAASAKGELNYDMSPRALLDWALSVQCGRDVSLAWDMCVIGRIPNLQHTVATRDAVARISEAIGSFKIYTENS